ncbi:adenylate/guanylate cyclase domain-containing protein [Thermodesulfobacteriota bacterium]
MNLKLKNNEQIRLIFILTISSLLIVLIFFWANGSIWTVWDYKILDTVYRHAVKHGYGPKMSHKIVCLPITDSTYKYFGKNILDRADIAMVNDALSEMNIEALAYDIIFARPSNPDSDKKFELSIKRLSSVYLPIGLDCSENSKAFKWEGGKAYERFKSGYLHTPVEKGLPNPYYAISALMQTDDFSMVALNSGHISALSDTDGVYRHMIMLLKVDNLYFPSLTLSMFLDYAGVPFEEIIVNWGKEIVIPATKGGYIDNHIIIPIDDRGQAFIPFTQAWEKDSPKMEAHKLLEYTKEENLQGNLRDFFEGKFVFIGDISVGASDLGQIPIERNVPLMITQTAMLNALLTNTFYKKILFVHGIALIIIIGVLLSVSALSKRSWPLYSTGVIILGNIIVITSIQFIRFNLFPVATISGSFLFIFFTLNIGIEIAVSKERNFIKNTFSRYVPQKVVNHLLENPALLKLGGEERIITVFFSDIADFTTISEKMNPSDLVNLLNEYLTEMTNIVLEEGGIIDKYQGDAIMAEFGVPFYVPNHADMAVKAGLRMQQRLKEMHQEWKEKGLPMLSCRVGINTGPMIIGNIGSKGIFDYTVIGDEVNLASRLEGANKRYNTLIMISESTYEYLTPKMFKTRILDVIRVKGKSKAVKVFEVYGETSETMDPNQDLYYQTYHKAFEDYLSRNFILAREKFLETLSIRSEDIASKEMLHRIDAIKSSELPNDWDGSIALKSK